MQAQLQRARDERAQAEQVAIRFERFGRIIAGKNPKRMTTSEVQDVFDDFAATCAKIVDNCRDKINEIDITIAGLVDLTDRVSKVTTSPDRMNVARQQAQEGAIQYANLASELRAADPSTMQTEEIRETFARLAGVFETFAVGCTESLAILDGIEAQDSKPGF